MRNNPHAFTTQYALAQAALDREVRVSSTAEVGASLRARYGTSLLDEMTMEQLENVPEHYGKDPAIRHPKLGDQGQRYEVWFKEDDGIGKVLGWSDDHATARRMADTWKLRPSTVATFVKDRHVTSDKPPRFGERSEEAGK